MSDSRHAPQRRAETVAAAALAVHAIFAGGTFAIAAFCQSRAVLAEAFHLSAGVWLWLSVILHLRHKRLADEERVEMAELERVRDEKGPGGALFEREGHELLVAQNRLAVFEKYFVLLCTVVMVGLLGWLSGYLVNSLLSATIVAKVGNAPLSAAFLVGQALLSFMFAKYAAGMATERVWRPLRAGGSYMASCAVMLFVVAVGLAFVHFEAPQVDRVIAYVVPACMGLLALEMLANAVLDVYRPRVVGREPRSAYDSRLLGLLVEPGTIVRTVADTLDYQFGFRVSDTWLYRFLEKALAPLILFQVCTFYLLTCVLIVGPDESAFIEHFGKPTNKEKPLGPGLYMKWPWPVEVVRRYPTKRIHEMAIGELFGEYGGGEELHAILWTKKHSPVVFRWLVAYREDQQSSSIPEAEGDVKSVPVNFISGMVKVYYKVTDLYAYLYGHTDGQQTLRQVTHREMTRYMGSVDVNRFLTVDRAAALEALEEKIQAEADRLELGVQLLEVGLQDVHPPVEVGDAYEAVVGASERKEAAVYKAEAYRNKHVPMAQADATSMVLAAEAYSDRRKIVTAREAERFKVLMAAYQKSPEVFRWRRRLAAMADALATVRKYVVPAWAGVSEVDVIDLTEKLQLDILDSKLSTN